MDVPDIEIKTEKPDYDDQDNNNSDYGLNGHSVFDSQPQTATEKLQLRRQPLYKDPRAQKREYLTMAEVLHREPLYKGNPRAIKRKYPEAAMKPRDSALGARCGEIFVTHNANKWTFVCTFCNKTTSDIGKFVLHCSKHLLSSLRHNLHKANTAGEIDDDYAGDDYEHEEEEDFMITPVAGNRSAFNDDYFDCGNYLDVNVHTEPGDYEGLHQQQQAESLKGKKPTPSMVLKPKEAKTASRRGQLTVDTPQQQQQQADNETNDGDDDLDYENGDDSQMFTPSSSNGALLPVATGERPKRRQIRGPAYCDLCDKTFQYYSLYRNHMIKHSNETPYKCERCDKSFKSKQALRYHAQTHERDKKFFCAICRVASTTEALFVAHMATHESAATYPCNVCGNILSSSKDRDDHMAKHAKNRPFRCNVCGFLFRFRHQLSNHLKIHRQYRCDFCKANFINNTKLHKPYACEVCQQLPDVVLRLNGDESIAGQQEQQTPDYSGDEQMDADQDTEEGGGAAAMLYDSVTENDVTPVDSPRNRSRATTSGMAPVASNRLRCQHCERTYSHVNGLNYHMRKKHPPPSDN